ncbi:hypothetical protein [Shinella oryzae]|uniref:F5/8 type C domain-containing protein n=1 Tax=Shinella oryzae TaxID=2871820 RepID=A0ABY9K290_9HYPH|nr:hypothetical protein [Shinella oryzae]WLS01756.1 hypothetical protein Q9315_09875 [Shinella oryzae]
MSLTAGSAVVTGIDTAWATALLKGGEIFVQAPGNPLPIATIDSDTQITAALAWTGATGVYEYVLRVATTYDQQIAKNAEVFARLRAEIEAGTIWKFDVSGELADRDTYDTRPRHFSFLEFGDPYAWLWVKASNADGDWAGPFAYGVGPEGPAPSLSFSPVATGAPGTPASAVVTGSGPYNLAFTIPAGLTGLRWRGAYNAGTSYLERDGVRDNGSTWIALQDTVGNAPPVLPSTSNAFWELVSAKGIDGTGTGDVVGPAGVIDGRPVVFDGTSGKLVKQGPLPFSGSYTDLSGKPNLGAAAALNVGMTAGTVAAGDDARIVAAGQNDALFALEIADLKGTRLGMKGGIADAFDDETGVGIKTNATYSAPNGTYTPSFTDGASVKPAAGLISWAGLSNVVTANLVDGSTSSQAFHSDSAAPGAYVEIDYGAGNEKALAKWEFYVNGANACIWNIQYHDGITFVTVATLNMSGGAGWKSVTWAPVGVRRRWRATLANTPGSGSYHTELTVSLAGATNNMTLESIAYAAAAQPSTGRLAVQLVETDAVTINTDLTAEISRDGGASWTAAALALSTSLSGVKIYEATGINIGAQPSGTSMKWRVKTLNNKNVAVSGVVMQWS